MTLPRHIAVIDIGKTNAKLALVDLPSLTEVAVLTRPNRVLQGPPWLHFDTEANWSFILQGLRELHKTYGVDAISATTHGASIVLLDHHGQLAAPILDYEHDGPMHLGAAYDAVCPDFALTGSPRFANGLNVGAQLHWQFATIPDLHHRTAHIVTYPQYWGYRLTGALACDVTSIGCHTDLWHPREGVFSDLVQRLEIADKIAPVRKPSDVLGLILPAIAQATGLDPATPVVCGIHDSNASLYPHLLTQPSGFSVASTGTWVVVMTMGGTDLPLDPTRDTLLNVNALGQATPSARFMGGREYDLIMGGAPVAATEDDMRRVLDSGVMLLPAPEPTCGPFRGRVMRWVGEEPAMGSGTRAAALAFYLALMTDTCLSLTGATGPTLVEGPFARNAAYLAMLGAATGRPVCASTSATGTSAGAALLFGDSPALSMPPLNVPAPLTALGPYAARWRAMVQTKDH